MSIKWVYGNFDPKKTNIYGWEKALSPRAVACLCRAIRDEVKLPPIKIVELPRYENSSLHENNLPTYIISLLGDPDNRGKLEGGHNRAFAEYIMGVKWLCNLPDGVVAEIDESSGLVNGIPEIGMDAGHLPNIIEIKDMILYTGDDSKRFERHKKMYPEYKEPSKQDLELVFSLVEKLKHE